MTNGYRCMDRTARLISERDFQIYENDIERYLNDNIGFSDLVLNNFRFIFAAYFTLLALYCILAAKSAIYKLRAFLRQAIVLRPPVKPIERIRTALRRLSSFKKSSSC